MNEFLRKIQLVEFDILKELDRIAKKHNIKYYLGQGTLLGAVKYKKFIPWDDDIDLLVPYKELVKLIRVFKKEADAKYKLTNCFIEKHFPVPWSKIRNTNTLSRPIRYKDLPINWGICIDLFPIYSVSNIALVRKLEYLAYKVAAKMIMAEFTKYEKNHGPLVRLMEKIPICIRHLFLKMVIGVLNLHGDNTNYVMVTCRGVKLVERDMLFSGENYVEFEENMFPTVSDYESYLTINYGDWRAELPPKEQRGHDFTLGDIEWKI